MDYNALAKQFGGTTQPAETNSAGANIDYTSLAKKYNGTTFTPAVAPIEEKKSLGRKVADFFTSGTQQLGKQLGNVLASKGNVNDLEKSVAGFQAQSTRMMDAIDQAKAQGKDTTRLQAIFKAYNQQAPQSADYISPEMQAQLEKGFWETAGAIGLTALEASSGGVLSSGTKTVLNKGITTAEKVLEGAKVGSAYGALGGGLSTMADGGGVADVAVNTALGSAIGAGLGAGLPLAGVALGKGSQYLTKTGRKTLADAKIEDTILKRAQEILKIDTAYVKGRKALDFSDDAGKASRTRVASTDVLANSVNEDGLIRTKQPGGAVEQYRAMTTDKWENVVLQNLERLDEKIGVDEIGVRLESAVKSSGLQGDDLMVALKRAKREAKAYQAMADENGQVPLALLQKAKINQYKQINYQTPPHVATQRKAIARGLKEAIEKNSTVTVEDAGKVYNLGQVNEELSKYYDDISLLERLDGARVKGGRLGKYFAQISGNIAGGLAGGAIGGIPGSAVGTIVGGELAGRIKGNILSKSFRGKAGGKPTNIILEKASAQGASPRNLPALIPGQDYSPAKGGSKYAPIRLGAPASIEPQSKISGNRNAIYANTNKPIKTAMSKPTTKAPAKSIVEEAKKYKSAEITTNKPITIYRGEGGGIGNATFVKGKYFADSEKFARTFGDSIQVKTIPAGTKIFDFDKFKSNPNQNIVPIELLVDPDALTKKLKELGYGVTKNTNSRGVEYVFLDGELPPLYKVNKVNTGIYDILDENNNEMIKRFTKLSDAKEWLAKNGK